MYVSSIKPHGCVYFNKRVLPKVGRSNTIMTRCKHNIFQESDNVSTTVSLAEISDLMDISENMRHQDKTDLFASYGLNYDKVSVYYDTVMRLESNYGEPKNSIYVKRWMHFICLILVIVKIFL
jgi:hypothetical protein